MPLVLDGTNGISGVNGSASSPAFEGTDADSGIFINSANEVNASLNSTPVWSAVSTFGFKNRIINGAMGISQRGTSFSTPANTAYTLDRWFISWSGAAPASVAQVAGPAGFRNALQITGAASNAFMFLVQRIESLNCSDLSGQTVTLQANIATSASQTVYWQLAHPNSQDNYSAATTIAFGTWSTTSTPTTFTATVTGLPANVTNGLQLLISPNNLAGFTSGTFTITGVQLEKGSTATSFDYRPYGTELALCQRYLPVIQGSGGTTYGYTGFNASTVLSYFIFTPVVQPRVPPTGITTTAASGFQSSDGITNTTLSSLTFTTANSTQVLFSGAATGLTAFRPCVLGVGGSSQILFTGCEL